MLAHEVLCALPEAFSGERPVRVLHLLQGVWVESLGIGGRYVNLKLRKAVIKNVLKSGIDIYVRQPLHTHILEVLVQLLVLLGGGLGYLRLRAPDLLKQLPVTLELGRSPWYHLAIERESISCLETEKGAIFYLILIQELLSP